MCRWPNTGPSILVRTVVLRRAALGPCANSSRSWRARRRIISNRTCAAGTSHGGSPMCSATVLSRPSSGRWRSSIESLHGQKPWPRWSPRFAGGTTSWMTKVADRVPGAAETSVADLASLRDALTSEISMAVDAFERDSDIRLRSLFEVALRSRLVQIADCLHERGAVARVLRVLQHHPPRVAGEPLEF